MRKLLPFVALVACASNSRDPAPKEMWSSLEHVTLAKDLARDGRIDATPPTRVGPPALSAEVELDAPIEDTAAGVITDAGATSDGTSFVFTWSASFGGGTAGRTRFARMTPTGTLLDPVGVTVASGISSLSGGPGMTLLTATVGPDLVATRIGIDGKRLDAAPLVLGKSSPEGGFIGCDFDGTQWV
ncbi:MAG: hypothetical protein ABI175_17000, partial [Polyangiales bacterium]